jgi:hypothetical protein
MIYITHEALDELAERILMAVRAGSVDERGLRTFHKTLIECAPHAVKAALDIMFGGPEYWRPAKAAWPKPEQINVIRTVPESGGRERLADDGETPCIVRWP